jgi:hypothetical protein
MIEVETTCRACNSVSQTTEDLPQFTIPAGAKFYNFTDTCGECNAPSNSAPPMPSKVGQS